MKWIKVKDRLPENSGYYLVCHKSNLPFTAAFNMWDNQNFTIIGGGHDAVIYELTHWMPLPEPPEEE